MKKPAPYTPPAGFTIFSGGPFHRLWEYLGLVSTKPNSVDYRTVVIPLMAWLPLLVLSVWQGRAWSGVPVPFLQDYEAQARFLLAFPLLLWAEAFADRKWIPALAILANRGVLREENKARFDAILTARVGRNNSILGALLLAVPVWLVGHFYWKAGWISQTATWYSLPIDAGAGLTPAGWWYMCVSIPIFQFIAFRWYLRLISWWFLLRRVARLDLHLIATHPDQAGGLGFLADRIIGFMPFIAAHGFLALGIFATRIFYDQRRLPEFWPEIVGFGVYLSVLTLGPLTAFMPALLAAKIRGKIEFGQLAFRYVREFESKWIKGGPSADDSPLGSADIQSLADLGGSNDVVTKMKILPFGKATVIQVLVPFVLPMAPLLFTMFPAEELLMRLVKMIF